MSEKANAYDPIPIKGVKPIGDQVIIVEMAFNERFTKNGIILLNDDKKTEGIRPRWGKVYAIGPEQKDVEVGQWICIEHGRWTRGSNVIINGEQLTIRRVDPSAIMLVSDEQPFDETLGNKV